MKTTILKWYRILEPELMKNLALGVLEEKTGGSDEDTDGIPSDNEGNILDKLMRRDTVPNRRDLISSVDSPSTNRASFSNSSVDSGTSVNKDLGESSEGDSDTEENEDGSPDSKHQPNPITETSHSIKHLRQGGVQNEPKRRSKRL